MNVSANVIVQHLMSLVKYVVLLVVMVLGFKYWTGRDFCKVASDDRGMRPAIGNTRTWLDYNRNAWTDADFAVGDVAVIYGEAGDTARAFPFRVVAAGGDQMMIDGGQVLRNGQNESYPGAEIRPDSSYQLPLFRVPRGYVFLMADNRQGSAAPNPFLVPVSRLMGKAKL